MPPNPILTSQIQIKLDGTVIQHDLLTKLVSVIVDQHTYLPGMFALTFFDTDLRLLDRGPFDLTKRVTISGEKEDGTSFPLIDGEITALEPSFNEGMIAEFVVRGYDKSHRLFRETKNRAFVNIKDSDLASQFAGAAGLSAVVDATSIVYDNLIQDNQTDLNFLMQRAWRIGYECFVADGRLYFRKPPTSGASVSLTWGQDLLSFQPRMTLAEQVNEVMVQGWDPKNKVQVVGRTDSGSLYAQIRESKDGATWAGSFGRGKSTIVNQPVISQSEAENLAKARFTEITGTFVEAEGAAFRRPDIQAGKFVDLIGLGDRFSGKYLVTSATHVFTPEGLKTTFTVRGAHTGLVSDEIGSHAPLEHWPGAVIAIVTNTDDPQKWGRVKVKYPWLGETVESGWARLIGPGGGKKAGFLAIPEVGAEVLVVFEHGDINFPFVLGGLWNGIDEIPPMTDSAPPGKFPGVRTWCSIDGHRITVYDAPDSKIEIITASGIQVVLDDKNKKILLDCSADVEIKSGTNTKITATGNMKLEASGNIDIQASGQVNIKGAMINLN